MAQPDSNPPNNPGTSVVGGGGNAPKTELEGFIRRADSVRARIQKLERITDDLAVLAVADIPDTPDAQELAWAESASAPMTLGLREVLIFSGLLALGIGAAFFVGYMASRMAPGWFEVP